MHNNRLEVLYVTFSRDLHWTRYSLESIYRFGTGLSGVTVVVPTNDVGIFSQFARYSTPECPVRIKGFLEYPGKGFVHHLGMKCYGDVFCPDADLILHMDPDCLFTTAFSKGDYVIGEKPVLVVEPYDAIKTAHPARYNWKRVTEEALKFDCTHETMCRHPAVHYSWLYRATRDHIEKVHATPFLDFVIKQKNSYPQGFGEFNTLGSYALKNHTSKYHIIDRKDQGASADPPSKLWQGWSYTGVTSRENAAKIKEILG